MRVLIEEVKGEVKLLSNKIDELVKSVDVLAGVTVTREELRLTIDPLNERVKSLEEFKNKAFNVVGIIAFAVIAGALVQVIPALKF